MRIPTKILDRVSRQSRLVLTLTGLLIVALVGYIDYQTGPFVGMTIFYMIPVCFISWFAGRGWGLTVALGAAVTSFGAQSLQEHPYANDWIILWNAVMRLSVFFSFGFLTNEVAERQRVEQTLRQQSGILQSILDSMGDGVIVADAKGGITLSNPMADRLLGGLTPKEWLSHHQTYLPEAFATLPAAEHPLLQAIRGQTTDGGEMFVRRAGLTEGTWLMASSRPLLDEAGKVRGGVIVFSDISTRKLMEKQIAEISDREQRRIGQDLHDGLCQQLVSTAFACELLREKLSPRHPTEAAQVDSIAEMINQSITQARQISRGLCPVRVELDGLSSALEELAASVQSRTSIACRFVSDDPVFIRDPVAGTNLFRIAQEAVNNAVKHGHATQISVGLGAVEDEVTMTIKDNGIGFAAPQTPGNGIGLHTMNYRARMIGASLDVRRGAGGGTIVICSFHNQKLPEPSHAPALTS